MTLSCLESRERLLDRRGVARPEDLDLLAHLDVCGECAGFARRTAAVSESLSGLPRRPAPQELDGLVVAALQAGHRQDRAVGGLRGLSRLPVPAELAGRALDVQPRDARAPAVLDRLVDEDLRDQTAAMARRFAGRLERRPAPRVLRDRLEHFAPAPLRSTRIRRILLAAAGVTLLLAAGGVWLLVRGAGQGGPDRDFEVRYESSLDALDPMARSLLAGLSGGLVDTGAKRRL
jgi:hypothetical protein